MKISVRVKAGSKQEKVERDAEGAYLVWVREPAREGKANEAVSKAIAEYFKVGRWAVEIISGTTSKNKIIEIATLAPLPE